MRRIFLLGLAISIGFHCAFNPEEPKPLDADKKYELTLYPAGVFPGGQTGLPVNHITSMASASDGLWMATWGGGAVKMNSAEQVTVYSGTQVSSDYGLKVIPSGSSAVYLSVDSNGQYWEDFISASVTKNSASMGALTNPWAGGTYAGTLFYMLSDGRSDGFLQPLLNNDTTVYTAKGTDGTAGTPASLAIDRPDSNSGTCILAEALTAITTDRENELLGVGYFWTDGNTTGSCSSGSYEPTSLIMALYRMQTDATLTNKNKSGEIKPIQFGGTGEIPTAVYYNDRSVGSFVNEFIYVGTSGGLYEVDLQSWKSIFDVKKYTESDGLPSLNIRAILITTGPDVQDTSPVRRIWAATDKGLAVFVSSWETLDTTSSDMPSDNVTGLAYFNGDIWASTDSGLVKILPIQQK